MAAFAVEIPEDFSSIVKLLESAFAASEENWRVVY